MQSRRPFLSLATFGLAVAISLNGCSDKPATDVLPAGSTVIALGDSLTYGYGASPETSYPATLAQLTQWRVINAGVNGHTSADVLARVDDIINGTFVSGAKVHDSQIKSPDLVLLGVGGNDVLRRYSLR